MKLFQIGDFVSHAGLPLSWKIECDALVKDEWRCIARMIMEYQTEPFRYAVGIPRGGVHLAFALNAHASDNPEHRVIVCDDVYTTGASFKEFIKEEKYREEDIIKWVAFSRRPNTDNVNSLFTMPAPVSKN